MIRAALYARYSSERQNERSIADQFAVLERHAEARGWTVVATFCDAAISGAAMANRPGLNSMLEQAEAGAFDLVLVEDEDRIARNQAHLPQVAGVLEYAGVAFATLETDQVDDMRVAFKGLIGAQYIKVLSQKTKRGMSSNAEKGLATGSRLYGYETEPGGAIRIKADEAETIIWIAERYVAGDTARTIAADLNTRGIPGPRGGPWNASTINGSRQRGNGILHTELYAGVKVWNRMDVRKDPRTGKRAPRMRPEMEWRRTACPELRIIPEPLWREVRARKAIEGECRPHTLTRHPRIFSGLLRCGMCGSSYTVYTTGKIVCTGYRERGTCTNGRTPRLDEIETRALEAVRDKLLTPDAVARAVRTYHAAAEARARMQANDRAPQEKRLAEIGRRIGRIVDAIERGTADSAMEQRMMELGQERDEITATLAQAEARPVTLHPKAAEQYAAMARDLRDALTAAAGGETTAARELAQAVRALIDYIEITPQTQLRGGPIDLTVHGRLALMLDEPNRNVRLGAMVAGGGYVRSQPSVHVKATVPLWVRR